VTAIREAFESAGVRFLDGTGAGGVVPPPPKGSATTLALTWAVNANDHPRQLRGLTQSVPHFGRSSGEWPGRRCNGRDWKRSTLTALSRGAPWCRQLVPWVRVLRRQRT
jgi:hypothetical protein